MAPSVVGSPQFFGFNDGTGPGGHVCTFAGGAPAVGNFDVLCVNSNTTVSTPTGFTVSENRVNNQGAYIFTRKAVGGEGDSVTIITSGNENTAVNWVRVAGGDAVDVVGDAGQDANPQTSTPAFTSAALAEANELALAFAALHAIPVAPTGLAFGGGFTLITEGTQGSDTPGVHGAVGVAVPVGPGTLSPTATWTNNASDRYMLFVSITESSGENQNVDLGLAAETDTALPMSVDVTASLGLATETDSALPLTVDVTANLGLAEETDIALPMTTGGDQIVNLGVAQENDLALPMTTIGGDAGTDESVTPLLDMVLACFCDEIAKVPKPPAQCCLRTGEQVAFLASMTEDECCQGLAWVRVVSIYPSTVDFPEQDPTPRGGCPPGFLAVVLELGVARCAPVGTARRLPTCEDWSEVSRLIMNDAAAMRRAFCCLPVDNGAKMLGVWEPLAVEGGCAGGTMTITIQVSNCDC